MIDENVPDETPEALTEEAPETEPETEPSDQAAVGLEDLKLMQDRLLRLRAEFDNYRKRESKERRASWGRAKGDLVKKLLASLDDLHRVATLDPGSTKASAVIEGVVLVERKLFDALGREGLTVIGEPGEPFNPHIHEAIGMWPAPSPEHDGTIAAVTVRGYQFGHQLLRPAQVQVYEHQAGGAT